MRHDAKLGLALGMLVIGFAVAFCFPRQPQPGSWPQLETPEPITDRELDFLPMRAYPAPRVEIAAASPSPPKESPHEPAPVAPTGVVPEPIVPAEHLAGSSAIADQGSSQTAAKTGSADPSPPENRPEPPQVYIVKAGDTLSGIANRFLGSGARFLEVYEANRDRLPSPDALQVGQELRIPPKDIDLETLAGAQPPMRSGPSPKEPQSGFERPGKPPWMADQAAQSRR